MPPESDSRRLPAFLAPLVLLGVLALCAWPLATRSGFMFDDHRYLAALREAGDGDAGALLAATVVENRWDDNWWIEDGTFVRFFRPLVILSYAVDEAIWGLDARGYVLTNLLLHALASWLVFACLRRLLPDAWALLGATAFVCQTSHVEQWWYVAGRTDTIAGVLFFGGLWMFLRGRRDNGKVWSAAVAVVFFLGLLAKEYTVFLPLLYLLLDRWLPDGTTDESRRVGLVRHRARLYGLCAAALLVFLVLRHVALGDGGSGARPYPYFYLPDREGFAMRTVAVWLSYCASLVTGSDVPTFLADLGAALAVGTWKVVTGAVVVVALLGVAMRSPLGRWCAVLFLLTLLPMLPVYSTSRYLYLPALGYCGILALSGRWLWLRHRALGIGWALLVVLPQMWTSYDLVRGFPRRPEVPTGAEHIAGLFRDAPLDFASDEPIYVIDLPMGWLPIQFLRESLEVQLGRSLPPMTVLVKSPHTIDPGWASVRVVDDDTIEIARPRGPLYQEHELNDFEQRRVVVGQRIEEDGYTVEIVGERDGLAAHVLVHFDRPLAQVQIGRFRHVSGSRWKVQRIR